MKRHLKGGALVAPVPAVMVSCGDMEKSNIITIAWCGITNTVPPKTYISVRPERHSYGIIKDSGEFVINLVPRNLAKTADYCGMFTGRKVDKFQKCALTKAKAEHVSAPLIEECPINIECKVMKMERLGSHDMFMAEVIAVDVSEEYVDEKGRFDVNACSLITFAHGEYYSLKEMIGTFGYTVRKKP